MMQSKIQTSFLVNYGLMFIISVMIGLMGIATLSFASDVFAKNLVKNTITAQSLMQDDYDSIDAAPVLENGGGIQVVNSNYEIVYSQGINPFSASSLSAGEFTEFLTYSNAIGRQFNHDVAYNSQEQFWLVVTFPTSLRIDFAIAHNKDYVSVDTQGVVGLIVSVVLFFFLLLALCTVIYSKLTSLTVVKPLKKLCSSARRLKDGDYSSRVSLNLNNEFGELESIFNEMAAKIELEMALRKQAEERRKQLVLDISHDLKNPLASIMGYAELCASNPSLSETQREAYLKTIYTNSRRANSLITDLFELSKLDSPEYKLNKSKLDICEFVREEAAALIPSLDRAGFRYDFAIPQGEILVEADRVQLSRVLQNLAANTIQANSPGTVVTITLTEGETDVTICFGDDGIGIPGEMVPGIFDPFVRVDQSRNSSTGGTGLGLAIVERIVRAHGGTVSLDAHEGGGCTFTINLPKN